VPRQLDLGDLRERRVLDLLPDDRWRNEPKRADGKGRADKAQPGADGRTTGEADPSQADGGRVETEPARERGGDRNECAAGDHELDAAARQYGRRTEQPGGGVAPQDE